MLQQTIDRAENTRKSGERIAQLSKDYLLSERRAQPPSTVLWSIMTCVSSIPCLLACCLLMALLLPSPVTFVAADDDGEVTTYQSIEEVDEAAAESIGSDHSHSLLVDLLKTQSLLLEATQDVAKATKDMSIAMMTSTSTEAIESLQESQQLLEEQITGLTGEFQNTKEELLTIANENSKLEELKVELTEKIAQLESAIETLKVEYSQTPVSTDTLRNSECPDTFEWVGEDCIYISRGDQRRTWHESRSICHDLGGELAVPSNLSLLATRLRGETISGVWVGATDNLGQGRWYWLMSGTTVGPEYWAEDFPKNDGAWTNCGALMRDQEYRMVEESCSFFYYYICQIFPKGFWKSGSEK